jgi:serine/threonine protein kinase
VSDSDNDKTIVLGGAAAAAPVQRNTAVDTTVLQPGTRLHEFEIVDLVGQGGFGIVYLADDHSLQRRVAIKEYMPSSLATRGKDDSVVVRSARHADTFEIGLRSFVNEARLLAQFDHPALLKVFRFWEANGTAYMAMPYYAGKTLRDALKEREGSPPDEAWIRRILAPVMDALELMHHENCFHRDVAPDNIMLLRDGRPVLLDFGAARRVISDMTQALTVILKPGYAPIEQYAEMPGIKQGPWTDIYALAAVVYFSITGRTPPPAVGRMMQDAYEPLATIAAGRYSAHFLEGIDRCLRVKGEERPQSIPEMRTALGMDEANATVFVPPAPSSYSSTVATAVVASDTPGTVLFPAAGSATTARPGKRPIYLAGLAALGAAAAGAYLFTRETPPKTVPPVPPQAAAPAAAAPAAPTSAAPTSAAPPAPAAPVSLEDAITATLAGSDNSFGLTVDKVRTPLVIGRDPLSFVLHSQRNGLLYVLLWDKATGHLNLIFPNELDLQNKVSAGKPVIFPRPDWAYEADPPQGKWEVITLVSASPRDFTGLRLESRASASSVTQDVIEEVLGKSAKGGPALGGEPHCTANAPCPPAYAAARFSVEEVTAEKRK